MKIRCNGDVFASGAIKWPLVMKSIRYPDEPEACHDCEATFFNDGYGARLKPCAKHLSKTLLATIHPPLSVGFKTETES